MLLHTDQIQDTYTKWQKEAEALTEYDPNFPKSMLRAGPGDIGPVVRRSAARVYGYGLPFPRAYGYVLPPLSRRYGYGYALRVNGVSPPPVSARRRRRRRPGPAAGAENFEPPQPIWRLHLHLGAPGRATATASALARAYGYVSTSGDILLLRTPPKDGPNSEPEGKDSRVGVEN